MTVEDSEDVRRIEKRTYRFFNVVKFSLEKNIAFGDPDISCVIKDNIDYDFEIFENQRRFFTKKIIEKYLVYSQE